MIFDFKLRILRKLNFFFAYFKRRCVEVSKVHFKIFECKIIVISAFLVNFQLCISFHLRFFLKNFSCGFPIHQFKNNGSCTVIELEELQMPFRDVEVLQLNGSKDRILQLRWTFMSGKFSRVKTFKWQLLCGCLKVEMCGKQRGKGEIFLRDEESSTTTTIWSNFSVSQVFAFFEKP